jgi:hypothetical protein
MTKEEMKDGVTDAEIGRIQTDAIITGDWHMVHACMLAFEGDAEATARVYCVLHPENKQ